MLEPQPPSADEILAAIHRYNSGADLTDREIWILRSCGVI